MYIYFLISGYYLLSNKNDFVSELVGPWEDTEGAGCGRDRDVAVEKKVFLLRPECGLQRPCPA